MNIKNKITILTNELANLKSKFATKLEERERVTCDSLLIVSGIDPYAIGRPARKEAASVLSNNQKHIKEELKRFEKVKENANLIRGALSSQITEWEEMINTNYSRRSWLQPKINKNREVYDFFATLIP